MTNCGNLKGQLPLPPSMPPLFSRYDLPSWADPPRVNRSKSARHSTGSHTATSSLDGSIHGPPIDPTTLHKDDSSSRTSSEHWILGDYTLGETLRRSRGKVKLATHNVTGEKVLVPTPSLPTHLSLTSFCFPHPSLLSGFCHVHTLHHHPQMPLDKRLKIPQRRSAPSPKRRFQCSSTIPTSAACAK